ncbi:MAG: hypothetical protein K8S98_03735, partial [Planctomycetes bacterium]|nr:hypothetical protein [Planctomycetota bacterium]
MSTDYASYGADPEVPEQSQGAEVAEGMELDELEEEEPEENDTLDFDLLTAAIPSFQALHQARASVFRNTRTLEAFKRIVESLSAAGDEGRRKGLGLWMQGDWQAASDQLAKYDDVVANFTRANALMAAERYKDALPIFEKLTNAYPEEPKPRGGMLEAKLELDFVVGDTDKTIANLRAG